MDIQQYNGEMGRHWNLLVLVLLFSGFTSFLAGMASAASSLPYTTRTHPYNGWSTQPQGDIRTVGMAGATVGLADTFIAALSNPAGLAMTLNGADSNFASNTIHDASKQSFDSPLNATNFGVVMNSYPWGFGFGYVSTHQENQPYNLPSLPSTTPATLSVTTQEWSLSFARVFFNNRLSVGASLILAEAETAIQILNSSNTSLGSTTISGDLGISYRLPQRLILGVNYKFPTHFKVDPATNPSPILPGFFQSVEFPSQLGMGLGWIPNRFFRGDLSVLFVSSINNAALIKDDVTAIGRFFTVQPRIGFAYTILDYKECKSTLFAGTYYETSRIENSPDRVHLTSGIEVKPWIFALGTAFDISTQYGNYLVSIGIDIVKTLEKLEVIPVLPHSPYRGAFPNPLHLSTEGLSGTLIQSGQPKNEGANPIKIGMAIPGKLQEKVKQISEEIATVVSPTPKTHKKRHKKTPRRVRPSGP